MAGRKWLLIDVSCLGYRAMYSTGSLHGILGTGEGLEATGTLYGVLAEVKRLYTRFGTHRMVFCFDWRTPWRRLKLYPAYKQNRRLNVTPELEAARRQMRPQIDRLRARVLPSLGYVGAVYHKDGYEADDLIAAAAWELPLNDTKIIVSSDKDLYQLLRRSTMQWSPNAKNPNQPCYTEADFVRDYDLHPACWHEVKAIAGCPSDNVPGCKGVAEKRAAQYVRGDLPKTTVAYQSIKGFLCTEQYETNLRLCKLPFDDLRASQPIPAAEDPFESGTWDEVVGELGFDSLRFKRERFALKRR